MTTSTKDSPEETSRIAAPGAHRPRAALRRSIWLLALGLLVAGAGGYWYLFMRATSSAEVAPASGRGGGPGGPNAAGRSTPVVVAPARKGDIGVYIAGLGSVTPIATVTVKSRVDGQLMKVLFREGQVVRSGDLLAEIDPRPYQVMSDQAEGQMAKDQALLKNAQIDHERYRVLFEQDSIARQQLDTQAALMRQYEGAVKVDQSAIDNAKLQLAYCRITAPASGRLGLRLVDPGNIVHASDAAGLVVITQLKPIAAVFTIPEDSLPPVMDKLRAGERLAVAAYDRADKVKLASGTLLTVDNQIDPATGTVKLKAQFANEDGKLFPNQFVNVHMLLDVKRDATLIPTAAIQRGTPGTFVYVVKPDSTVTLRVVKPGPTQGDNVSIDSGLAPGEPVVVDGADKLREGAKVEAVAKDAPSGGPRKGDADGGRRRQPGGAAGADVAAPAAQAVASAAARANPAQAGASGGGQGLSAEERQKSWSEINARIDRGDFGEEIKKLPEEARKQRMRELRAQRDAGQSGTASRPDGSPNQKAQ